MLFRSQTDSNPYPRLFSIWSAGSGEALGISLEGGTMYFWENGGVLTSTVKPNSLGWNHFAMNSDGTSVYCWLNGNQVSGTGGALPDISGRTLYIGVNATDALPYCAFGGFMNSFRWTLGNQVYTGNFTVPTSA